MHTGKHASDRLGRCLVCPMAAAVCWTPPRPNDSFHGTHRKAVHCTYRKPAAGTPSASASPVTLALANVTRRTGQGAGFAGQQALRYKDPRDRRYCEIPAGDIGAVPPPVTRPLGIQLTRLAPLARKVGDVPRPWPIGPSVMWGPAAGPGEGPRTRPRR